MNYARPELLVETDWLESHLQDDNLRIYDCSVIFSMGAKGISIESGRTDYEAGHIPGAGFLDLTEDLVDPSQNLPMMLPPADRFEEIMSAAGIGPDNQVILYSARATAWATRAWWMLGAHGFDNVSLLNGGWNKWLAETRPVSQSAAIYPAGRFESRFRPDMVVDMAQVRVAIDATHTCLVNALSAEAFSGAAAPYARPGRIPKSVNVPAGGLENPDTLTFLPAEALKEKFEVSGSLEKENVIAYCGGGVAATQAAFALALLGKDNVAVYDGSLTEWAANPAAPMEVD